jgi:hypothetical protein
MPKYTVTIREDSVRYYEVEAGSPEDIKRLWQEDENGLGEAYDSKILLSEMTVQLPDGKILNDSEIELPEDEEL